MRPGYTGNTAMKACQETENGLKYIQEHGEMIGANMWAAIHLLSRAVWQ
jgi:hypothetical protein